MNAMTENPRGFGGTPDPELNDDGEEMATEEEQMNYDLLATRGRKMIFGDNRENVLKMLGSSESPAQGIGKVGSMIIKSLMDSSKQAGREITGETALNAATEIIDDLNELGKSQGVFTYDSDEDEEKELADALLWGTKYYGEGMIASGEITPDMRKTAKAQVMEGIAEENKGKSPKKTKVAEGVSEAVNQPAPGLIGQAMQGGI
ncbi:MAG: hypothetical protein JRC99_11490 [Deltaproteobacteria bacterium]|nr:hypothetical protein [Deltaproteobacteria bacterium]